MWTRNSSIFYYYAYIIAGGCAAGRAPKQPTPTSFSEPSGCVSVINDLPVGSSPAECKAPGSGNPIYPLAGNKREAIDTRLQIGGEPLLLTYDSTGRAPMTAGAVRPPELQRMSLGRGLPWFSSIHRGVWVQASGRGALVARGNGRTVSFAGNGAGIYTARADTADRLLTITGGFRYIDAAAASQETYDGAGNLTAIKYARGDTITLTYSTAATPLTIAPAAGYLIQAVDNNGRSLNFSYQLPAGAAAATGGRLSAITDPAGEMVTLAYDTVGNLSSITWPDTKVRQFLYELPALNWALTGVVDERGLRKSTFGYDVDGRAISTENAGAVNRYSVTYGTPPSIAVTEVYDGVQSVLYRRHEWLTPQATVLTKPLGAPSTLAVSNVLGKSYLTSQSQPAGSGCAASTSAASYDTNGNTASRDDFNGKRVCYANDLNRNLELTRVEGLSNTQACLAVTPAGAVLPAGSRKVSTAWHPDWKRPTTVAEAGRLTTSVYNGQPDPFNGNAIASCAPGTALLPDGKPLAVLCKKVEQATLDASGSTGLNVAGSPADLPDPYFNNVTLLLHMDGSNGGAAFIDSSSAARSPSSVTATAVTDTTNANYGLAAGNFTGGYIRYADSPDFDLAGGDFTIEAWMKFSSASVGQRVYVYGKANSNSSIASFSFSKPSSNKLTLEWATTGGWFSIQDTVTVAANTWYHVAVVRSGGTMTLWKNGVSAGSRTVAGALVTIPYSLGVGVLGDYTGAYGGAYGTRMMGWLDDFRITKGVARYTSAFTPPTAALGSSVSGSPAIPSQIDPSVPMRTWSYTYNQYGQVLSEDGPRTDVSDVTTYAYYADTTADHTVGDLQTRTDALGKVTTYTKYNKHGQVLEMTDPNGVLTVNTYDLRQRLLSTSVGGQTTSYTYDPAGQLTRVTLPDASYVGYEYDAAHRQTAVLDNLGNRIEYTLDNAGNRTAESVKDPGGSLKRTLARSLDALGRVQQTTGRE